MQPVGSFHSEMMKGDAPPLTPGFVLETMKHHAVPWWLTTEDLPDPDNRVTFTTPPRSRWRTGSPESPDAHPAGDTGHTNESEPVTDSAPGRIQLSYTPNNVESFNRLKDRWVDILKQAGHATTSVPLHAYFKKRIPLEGVGHQNGTCRMGNDPATSVLDPHCKAHDLDNLYVVDASCFVSASAVNPSLTIIANAIRIADHLLGNGLSDLIEPSSNKRSVETCRQVPCCIQPARWRMPWLLFFLRLIAGAANPFQAGANAQLNKQLQQPVLAGVFVYATGFLVLLMFCWRGIKFAAQSRFAM